MKYSINAPKTELAKLVRRYHQTKMPGLSIRQLADLIETSEGHIRAFYAGQQAQGRTYRGLRARNGEEPLAYRLQRFFKIPANEFKTAILQDALTEADQKLAARKASMGYFCHISSHLRERLDGSAIYCSECRLFARPIAV